MRRTEKQLIEKINLNSASFMEENDLIILKALSPIEIESRNPIDPRKESLIKNIIGQIKQSDMNSLDTNQLEKIIKEECENARSSDNLPMNYLQALHILSNLDFSGMNEDYAQIISKIKILYTRQSISSEVHHLKAAEDLHFYMVKVNGANASDWYKFGNDNGSQGKAFIGSDNAKANVGVGATAFCSMIQYHDQDLTDTYIAFVTNKPWIDQSKIDSAAIEMFVTMTTSQNAHFTSHLGIARAPSYSGPKHPDLAMKLHGFIARCTKEIYKEQKQYMITVPTIHMKEIMIKAFIKRNNGEGVYIGHQDINVPITDQSFIQSEVDKHKEHFKQHKMLDGYKIAYDKLVLQLELCEQKKALEDSHKIIPIKLINKEGSYREYTSFSLQSQDKELLNKLDTKQQAEEYAWFCRSPYLLKNHDDEITPLITSEMNQLAHFSPSGEMTYEYSSVTIGDALLLS